MTHANLSDTVLLDQPSCGISDDRADEMARETFDKITADLKAPKGKAIVWFKPWRKEGQIEVPWDYKPNSVEAAVWHDNSGYELPRGTRVMCRPDKGIYFDIDGVRLCTVEGNDMLLVEESDG